MILEKGCAERGCACYDVRVDEGVEVKVVRELTDEEIDAIGMQSLKETISLMWNSEAARHFAHLILKKASERA